MIEVVEPDLVDIDIFFFREKKAHALVVRLGHHLEHFVISARLDDDRRRHAREKRAAGQRNDENIGGSFDLRLVALLILFHRIFHGIDERFFKVLIISYLIFSAQGKLLK